jgi:uncharacterized membrane protein YphA (DoxX/SURF4 family)
MASWLKTRDLPGRIITGAYIVHAGLQKLHANEARDTAVHGLAAGAFPVLNRIPPARFVRMLAVGELGTGAALLAPFVSTGAAGAALTAFSGALVTMYARTPSMREPGSIWPSSAGTAVSKDVWMLGIGLGFLVDAAGRRGHRSSGSSA